MFRFVRLSLMAFLLWMAPVFTATAQCPTCIIDYTCVSGDGLPTICPFELPPATAGVYYENYLTFYLPAQFTDSGTGLDVTLLEITINSVTGMPYGMDFTLGDEDGIFYPNQGDNYGCATICGTPILPGVYDINISVHIVAEIFGISQQLDQSFFYTFVVEPGEGGNNSFTFSAQAGCGSLDVDFEATLDLPSVTTWEWDFGNGNTSTEQFPPTQTFDQPLDYVVSLNTIISDYLLTSVTCSSVDDYWDGDIDDIISPPGDVFFYLTDGDGNTVYTSTTQNNNAAPSWSGLSVVLSNPPYNISFVDVDDITADDPLGTSALSVQQGSVIFDTGTGTVGTAGIYLDVTSTVYNEEVISVFPIPDATFEVAGGTMSYSDPELTSFVWMLFGEPIDNEFGNSLVMTAGGLYSCTVTNQYGCSATSDEYLWCPVIAIQFDDLADVVYVESVYESYQWYFNGLPVDGATQPFLSAAEVGNYMCSVTTDYGCSLDSEVYSVTVGVEESVDASAFVLSPNPAHSVVHCQPGNSTTGPFEVSVIDLVGRTCFFQVFQTGPVDLPLDGIAPGPYIVQLKQGGMNSRQRLVVE